MPSGGARKGAGRKPGSKTVRTRAAAERILKRASVTPLDVLVGTMQELWRQAEAAKRSRKKLVSIPAEGGGEKVVSINELRMLAVEVASKAAPYLHPRLANVQAEIAGKGGGPLEHNVTHGLSRATQEFLADLASPGGAAGGETPVPD